LVAVKIAQAKKLNDELEMASLPATDRPAGEPCFTYAVVADINRVAEQ
jgi:hypothetical protein